MLSSSSTRKAPPIFRIILSDSIWGSTRWRIVRRRWVDVVVKSVVIVAVSNIALSHSLVIVVVVHTILSFRSMSTRTITKCIRWRRRWDRILILHAHSPVCRLDFSSFYSSASTSNCNRRTFSILFHRWNIINIADFFFTLSVVNLLWSPSIFLRISNMENGWTVRYWASDALSPQRSRRSSQIRKRDWRSTQRYGRGGVREKGVRSVTNTRLSKTASEISFVRWEWK